MFNIAPNELRRVSLLVSPSENMSKRAISGGEVFMYLYIYIYIQIKPASADRSLGAGVWGVGGLPMLDRHQ